MSLRAPVAVPVEIQTGERRFFRLSHNVGVDGLKLARPVPVEPGRPVQVAFTLPAAARAAADAAPVSLGPLRAVVELDGDEDGEGEHGGRQLAFLDPTSDTRHTLAAYVRERLELP